MYNKISLLTWPISIEVVYSPIFVSLPVCDDLIGGEKENFHHRVVEHKDIKKVVVILKSAVSSLRRLATDALKQFDPFRVIWDEDRSLKVKVCFPANVLILTFKQKIYF